MRPRSKLRLERGVDREDVVPNFCRSLKWLQVDKKYDHITGTAQKKLAEVEAEVEKDGLL